MSPTTICLVTFAASATAVVLCFGFASRRLTQSVAIVGAVASAVALLTLSGELGTKGDPYRHQVTYIVAVAAVATIGELIRWRRS